MMKKVSPRVSRRLVGLVAVSVAALAVAGCDTKFTGGGTIPSADDVTSDQANFGFNYKVTNLDTGAGNANGTYQDPFAPDYPLGGVQLKFTGLMSGDTGPSNECVSGTGINGTVNYTSQNSNYPGTGTLGLAACDMGQPAVTRGDAIAIGVLTGPYASPDPGYFNAGFLTGGNLKSHK
jgi:hypothetical protein